jgi:3-dehydroquinate synthase
METKIVTIDLDTRSYDIYIGNSLLFRMPDFMPQDVEGKSIFIVTDTNVQSYAERIHTLLTENNARICAVHTLPAGEATKSFQRVEEVCGWMLENGLSRDSIVIAVGGGVIGDLTGFCASVVMRGVPYIQVPTTLLSQVDSSVGGKTGINTKQGKNLVGSFYQPSAVIADLETLKTLPKRELLAGYAEVLKYGLIQDAGFFKWLESNGERVIALEDDAVAHAIEVSCRAKAATVEADEQEHGRRALLNFGHTFGHALEAEAGYDGTLLHGEAISIGMVIAMDLSVRLNLCSEDDFIRVEEHLLKIGLPTRASLVDGLETSVDRLMKIMERDKKVKNGKLVFVVANAIGDAFISDTVPVELARDVLVHSLGGESKGGNKGIKDRWLSAFSSQS